MGGRGPLDGGGEGAEGGGDVGALMDAGVRSSRRSRGLSMPALTCECGGGMPVVLAPAWCDGAGWVVATTVECVVATVVVACTRGVAATMELEAAIELLCVW